jgi:hypothetical protein
MLLRGWDQDVAAERQKSYGPKTSLSGFMEILKCAKALVTYLAHSMTFGDL